MSPAHRRFVIAYAFLVALPIMGLLAVLKTGKSLSAPMSVEGVWTIQADPVQFASLACADFANADPTLTISQSGRRLAVTLGGLTKADGALEGSTVRASFAPAAASSKSCATNHAFSLSASIDRTAMNGVLAADNCPSCAALPFRAVRQPNTAGTH